MEISMYPFNCSRMIDTVLCDLIRDPDFRNNPVKPRDQSRLQRRGKRRLKKRTYIAYEFANNWFCLPSLRAPDPDSVRHNM